MRIGLQIPNFTWPGGAEVIHSKLAEIAQTAEEAGFYSLWVMDHYFQIPSVGDVDEPMLEAYTTLSYMAALTARVKLGALVSGNIYRYPAILVKQDTTLDVLSAGRAYLGIGTGWFEREADGLGVPFPSLSERFERLEETLQIAHQMWSDDNGPYDGKYYQLEETLCVPQPLSQPHPPIMIGGMGEQKTLRMVAQYADACNLFIRAGNDVMAHKLDVLKQHCEDVGRPYDEIEKTGLETVHIAPGEMTANDVIEECRALAELGFQHLIFNMPNVSDITPLKTFGAEIIPAVAEL